MKAALNSFFLGIHCYPPGLGPSLLGRRQRREKVDMLETNILLLIWGAGAGCDPVPWLTLLSLGFPNSPVHLQTAASRSIEPPFPTLP